VAGLFTGSYARRSREEKSRSTLIYRWNEKYYRLLRFRNAKVALPLKRNGFVVFGHMYYGVYNMFFDGKFDLSDPFIPCRKRLEDIKIELL
jgi:hypothetical protein